MHCRCTILCAAWVLFAIGCAATRRPPDRPEVLPAILSQDVLAAPEDSSASVPEKSSQRIYRLFRRAFAELQANRAPAASSVLDSAAIALADLMTSASDALPPARLAGLVRVTLELYRDLLPAAAPLHPRSPLAHLLDVLPGEVTSAVADHPYYREFRIRKLAGTADVPIDYTPEVVNSIRYFQTDARQVFQRWLSRSGAYLPMIRRTFREAGLPEDLAYLAMIESGFKPHARSRARAVGLWQFVGHTARLYGLNDKTWIDERRDPEKATRAAARYLQHLYGLFGDWRLAVAAYNCGQGRLSRAIRESGTKDYWRIKGLPGETRNHVPRFMAAALIAKDPEWFGFGDVAYRDTLAYDVVQVSECVDLRIAAECAGVPYEQMRELNAELRAGYTPPDVSVYALRVPVGTAGRFRANYARVPAERKVQVIRYRVKSRDTVSGIAARLGVRQQAILDANGIHNPRRLRAGTWIKIPLRPGAYARAKRRINRQMAAQPDPSQHIRITYTVKRGDILWDIAQRRGVTPEQVWGWSNLPPARYPYIYPGNQLVIWKPRNPPEPPAADAIEIAASGDFYTVKRGDTLWDIARTFRIRVSDLKRWNGIRRGSRILPGTKLRVRPAQGPEAE